MPQAGLERGTSPGEDVRGAQRWPRGGQDAASNHPRHSSAENTANSPSPCSARFFSAAGDACERHEKVQRHPYVGFSEVPHHHFIVHELDNEAPQDAESEQPSSEHAEEAVFERAPVVEEDEGNGWRTPRSSPYAVNQSQRLMWNCLHNIWSEKHIQKISSREKETYGNAL